MYVGFFAAVASALMWGLIYAMSEKVVERMDPLSAFAVFYYAGAVLLLPVLLTNRQDMAQGIAAAPKEFVGSVLAIMFAEFFTLWSIKLIGGTQAAFIEVTYPVWTAVFALVLYGTRTNGGTLIGGTFIMVGLAVTAFAGNGDSTP